MRRCYPIIGLALDEPDRQLGGPDVTRIFERQSRLERRAVGGLACIRQVGASSKFRRSEGEHTVDIPLRR